MPEAPAAVTPGHDRAQSRADPTVAFADPPKTGHGSPPVAVGPGRTDRKSNADATPSGELPGAGRPGDEAGFRPIARTKITPVPVHPETLSRTRLIDWLRDSVRRRVTLVTAEAGYGKTTLLAEFSQTSGIRCLWYKLDGADRDWVTFINYLVAAVAEAIPGFAPATRSLLEQLATVTPARETVVRTFISELDALATAPTVLILDDYHLVDDSTDVRDLMSRILRQAPATVRVVILSRRLPNLPLARLRAQGEVAELDTEQLRFAPDETERLFREVYGEALDSDLIDEIDRRIEGWGASLQLLHSSIRGRTREQAREFIGSLSGGRGALYDFLAEEVLCDMPVEMQRFFTHASILERIVPRYVVVMLDGESDAPDEATVEGWIGTAEALGLLNRRSESSTSRRFHPLLRDFFRRRLEQRADPDRIRAMHAKVARAAEPHDWLTACRHYIEALEPTEAMRVLGGSVLLALGTGSWGAASEILSRLDDVALDPAVIVILARDAMEAGDVPRGLALLEGIDLSALSPLMRALVRQARMHGAWRNADDLAYRAALAELTGDPETPPPLKEIARAYTLLGEASRGGALEHVSGHLVKLAERQSTAGHSFFAAITRHNAMQLELARGQYEAARALGHQALREFAATGRIHAESFSTQASLATCELELGYEPEARRWIHSVSEATTPDADALAECIYTAAVAGWKNTALELEARLDAPGSASRIDLPGADSVLLARAAVRLAMADAKGALSTLERLPSRYVEPVARVIRLAQEALALLMLGARGDALRAANEGVNLSNRQGAVRWWARMAIVRAAADENHEELRKAVTNAARTGHLALLETADVIAERLTVLSPLPAEVTDSIGRWPDRWLPVLRRQLEAGPRARARVAAELLDKHGTLYDVPRLRAFDRRYNAGKPAGLGKSLARRTSPVLRVHDLGRTRLEIGHRSVTLASMRRKPASLLAYLVTRPSMTATREQVLETLWPDLKPSAASNSLNQTLYFLRRDIDPWYDDDVSADYVCFESELLWLDQELVRVGSGAFMHEARRVLRSPEPDASAKLLNFYDGQFAPEFEYEDWALGYREKVHAAFLAIAHAHQVGLMLAGDLRGATEAAQRVLEIDPGAMDVERNLIWTYGSLGARSAATEQYAHYSALHRDELGEEPPSLDVILGSPPGS